MKQAFTKTLRKINTSSVVKSKRWLYFDTSFKLLSTLKPTLMKNKQELTVITIKKATSHRNVFKSAAKCNIFLISFFSATNHGPN